MKAYISIGFKNRILIDHIVLVIKDVLKECKIDYLIFVDRYQFSPDDEKQMMDQAFKEIDSSEIIIVEGSEKAIGVGIETGYARARNKTILYLRNKNSEHSTTLAGTADYHLYYDNENDLKEKLVNCLENLINVHSTG